MQPQEVETAIKFVPANSRSQTEEFCEPLSEVYSNHLPLAVKFSYLQSIVSVVNLTVALAHQEGVDSGFSCVVFPLVLDGSTGARSPTAHSVSSRTKIFIQQITTFHHKPQSLRLNREERPSPILKALTGQWQKNRSLVEVATIC